MFSGFGTRSNSVGSITWPAQWHRAVHYHRDRRGKLARDTPQPAGPRAAARGARRRPRPLRIKQTAPNTEGAEAAAIAHPSCTSNSGGTEAFGAGTGEKAGRSAQFDAMICAPKRHNFRLRHGKARGNRRRREHSRRSARGTCPAQRSSQADKGRRTVAPAAEPPWAAPTARRHGSRTSFSPNHTLVAAASVPKCGRHGRRALPVRVIAVAGPRELPAITDAQKLDSRECRDGNATIASVTTANSRR